MSLRTNLGAGRAPRRADAYARMSGLELQAGAYWVVRIALSRLGPLL